MTRCDNDGVFYRVFCITLLEKVHSQHATQNDIDAIFQADFKSEPYYNEEKSYDDTEYGYRTKRSLESQNFFFRFESPKLKNIMKSRLATILENLDEEESENLIKNGRRADKIPVKVDNNDEANFDDNNNKNEDNKIRNNKHNNLEADVTENDNLLHLAMHNIILQGIVGHADLNEVYRNVQALERDGKGKKYVKAEDQKLKIDETNPLVEKTDLKKSSYQTTEEKHLYDELVNCKKLHKQIEDVEQKIAPNRIQSVAHKGPNILIKTVIDIKSQADDKIKKENTANATVSDNIKGIIKLIYNGRSIKFSRMDDEVTTLQANTGNESATTSESPKVTTETIETKQQADTLDRKYSHLSKDALNKILNDYFLNNNKGDVLPNNLEKIDTKRSKRHIKIRYETEDVKHTKHSNKNKTDDNELFVEIETHFDSNGMKGDKKKKLIRSLIEKIQKAIHEPTSTSPKKKSKSHRTVHVKKRTQNRLGHKEHVANKGISPLESLLHRQMDPISKVAAGHDPITEIYDKTGDSWRKKYIGPGFLTHTKGLNSAEMGEVEVDYDKIMTNGIPQRYQKPLNMENDEVDDEKNKKPYNIYNLGNLKFFMKDIDGTGFAVGFNQFVDEPPDAESIKLFTGLENIIQTYHQQYDPNDLTTVELQPEKLVYPNNNESKEHVLVRRSVTEKDYHSNEYKVIFGNYFLGYENYQDIFKDKTKSAVSGDGFARTHKKAKSAFQKTNQPSLIIDERFLSKSLKPAEIFDLANLLDRQKRSMTVKKISNLSKIKMSRYINTKPKVSKHYYNRKRNKRQINKIRIIASEMPNSNKHSEENIFVVSDENLFADRAIVRDVDTPDVRYGERETGHISKLEDHYDVISPYVYEDNKPYTYMTNIFDSKARHNTLMSKYPHIFMEEISRSKEEDLQPHIPLIRRLSQGNANVVENEEQKPSNSSTTYYQPVPQLDDIVDAISPSQPPKANYKVTVKILPKNVTDVNSGFKEVHTSINKSFNKNGLMYSSLVNVSEISKITKMNKTKQQSAVTITTISPLVKKLKDEQEKVQEILKKHKERIDEQLLHLNKEKDKLESMMRKKKTHERDNHSNEYMDIVLSSDPPKVVRLSKNDVNKLAATALMTKGDETVTPTTTTTTTPRPVTTIPLTTVTTPKPKTPTKENFEDEERFQILKTIEKNGNLTYQILQNIDKNTQILQKFLVKITDRIQPVFKTSTIQSITPKEVLNPKIAINAPKDWKKFQPIQDPFFAETMPNLEVHKNNSHVSIPFIYAYQQPYHLPSPQLKTPVASVLYHGHIHTNALPGKDDYWKTQTKKNEIEKAKTDEVKKDANQSRFFLDGPEAEFKVIPVSNKNEKPLAPNDLKAENKTKLIH